MVLRIPKIRFGDAVAWYRGGVNTTEPELGFVVSIGVGGMVGLRVFPRDTERTLTVQGCRYAGDTAAKEGELQMAGSWEPIEAYQEREEQKRKDDANKASPLNLSTMRQRPIQPVSPPASKPLENVS